MNISTPPAAAVGGGNPQKVPAQREGQTNRASQAPRNSRPESPGGGAVHRHHLRADPGHRHEPLHDRAGKCTGKSRNGLRHSHRSGGHGLGCGSLSPLQPYTEKELEIIAPEILRLGDELLNCCGLARNKRQSTGLSHFNCWNPKSDSKIKTPPEWVAGTGGMRDSNCTE